MTLAVLQISAFICVIFWTHVCAVAARAREAIVLATPSRGLLALLLDCVLALLCVALTVLAVVAAAPGREAQHLRDPAVGLGALGLCSILFAVFAYRRHRRQENAKYAAFISSLEQVSALITKLDSAPTTPVAGVHATCRGALADIRRFILRNHNTEHHNGLFLSIHEMDALSTLRRYRTIALCHDDIPPEVCTAVERTEQSAVMAAICAERLQPDTPLRLTFGSLCGYGYATNDSPQHPYPYVSRIHFTNACKAIDDGYLESVPTQYREQLTVRSHLRVELTTIDADTPAAIARECSYPLIACANVPLYFTKYDATLLRMCGAALQRYLRRSHDTLRERSTLVAGERELVRSLLETSGSTSQVLVSELQSIHTRGLPRHLHRRACGIAMLDAARQAIVTAQAYETQPWILRPVARRHKPGVLMTHVPSAGQSQCHDFLRSQPSELAASLADIMWITSAVRHLSIASTRQPVFVRADLSTLTSDRADETLRWLAQRLGKRCVVVFPIDAQGDTDRIRRAISAVKASKLRPCLDRIGSEEQVRLADELDVRWIRISITHVAAARSIESQRDLLRRIIALATTKEIRVIVPGTSAEDGRRSTPSWINEPGAVYIEELPP